MSQEGDNSFAVYPSNECYTTFSSCLKVGPVMNWSFQRRELFSLDHYFIVIDCVWNKANVRLKFKINLLKMFFFLMNILYNYI